MCTRIKASKLRRPHNAGPTGARCVRKYLAGVGCFLAWASPVQSQSIISQGEALVRSNCSPCHAVGLDDKSPHPDAPAFRTLSERYPIEDLAEALAEGISTGHPDMPEFVASPEQIDAIIAYIGTLQRK